MLDMLNQVQTFLWESNKNNDTILIEVFIGISLAVLILYFCIKMAAPNIDEASKKENNTPNQRSQLDEGDKNLELASNELLILQERIRALENAITEKDKELQERTHALDNALTEKDKEAKSKALEICLKDKNIHTLENKISEMNEILESKSSEVMRLEEEGMKIKEELYKVGQEASKCEQVFKSQQADIDFLRSHITQLTQKISVITLPLAKEIREELAEKL